MVLRFFAFLVICSFFPSSFSQTPAFPEIELEPVISGLTLPTYATTARDGSGRIFIVQLNGFVRILSRGQLQETPFLNLDGLVTALSGEQGMYSIAFHPNYKENGRFFVSYTEYPSNDVVVREHRVSEKNPNYAYRVAYAKDIIRFHPRAPYHQGGQLAFGPDGYLYVSFGDGGAPLYTYTPNFDVALRYDTFAGKILRIDVDNGDPYSIPSDNPFSQLNWVKGEIYALGFRNPWKFSFDRQTGNLLAADVGNYDWEEINLIVAGGNYGWPAREGPVCFVFPDNKAVAVPGCDNTRNYLEPLITYGHMAFEPAGGNAVLGGYVYRGSAYPSMQGLYFYADFTNGRIWALQRQGKQVDHKLLAETGLNFTSFVEDETGELFLLAISGELFRIKAK
ncbi:MAG: PQQ-dependent sugar dehydrogenase [Trueperaceae bacterium]|nr:PQQ-dependent sugar dehydrogenase [Trueperaceae bacterium]